MVNGEWERGWGAGLGGLINQLHLASALALTCQASVRGSISQPLVPLRLEYVHIE